MRRRDFISALTGAAWSLTADAQPLKQMHRIGFLRVGPPPASFIDGFRQGLREQGYAEGQHYVIEYSLAQSAAQIPEAAAELVRHKVDIIVASGTPSVLPARDAAGPTPVVFVATIDPVAVGLVANLARPVGNITGMTTISADVTAKRLQMVRQLLPQLSKIALLIRESSPDTAQYVKESENATRNLSAIRKISKGYLPRYEGRAPWSWQMTPSLQLIAPRLQSLRSRTNCRPFSG